MPTSIRLVYKRFKTLKNYDEVPTIGGSGKCGNWSDIGVLPVGLSCDIVPKMLPIFLFGKTLQCGHIIKIKLLDTVMIFDVGRITRVLTDDSEDLDTTVSPKSFTISNISDVSIEIIWCSDGVDGSLALNSDSIAITADMGLWCDFVDNLYRNVSNIAIGGLTLKSGLGPICAWMGARSILICGNEGAGKSTAVKLVLKRLCSPGHAEALNFDWFILSCCDSSKYLDATVNQTKQMMSPSMCIKVDSYITRTISHMNQNPSHLGDSSMFVGMDRCNAFIECLLYNISNGVVTSTLLVLDDLDTLLQLSLSVISGHSSSDDDPSDDEGTFGKNSVDSYRLNIYSNRVSFVFRILCLVTKAKCCYPIVVFGVSCCVHQNLLHKFPLARKFEFVTLLVKPSMNDNRGLLLHCFRKLLQEKSGRRTGYRLENVSGAEDGAMEWTDRICGILFNSSNNNGLTGGYLPIDIVDIVRSIQRTHEGSSGLISNVVLWKTALLCCSSFTPIVLRQASTSKALRKVGFTSAASNSSSVSSDNCSWNAFGGYFTTRQKLTRLLTLLGGAMNAPAPRGILLYGPTGCGKTFLAKVIAFEARMAFISIRSTELLAKYYGETEAMIRNIFSQARVIAPCVLFFDEFDAIACRRSDFGGNLGSSKDDAGGWRNRVLSTFLNEMDGIGSSCGNHDMVKNTNPPILIITACQDKDLIDEALLRPGRLQYHFHLHAPTFDDLYAILVVKLKNIFCNGLVEENIIDDSSGSSILVSHVQKLAEKLHQIGATGADIDSVCHRAILNAIKEAQCNNNVDRWLENEITAVSINHFYSAISDIWSNK